MFCYSAAACASTSSSACVIRPITVLGEVLFHPSEEFLRYLKRQCPCSTFHCFSTFLKVFRQHHLDILAERERQLLLLRPCPRMQFFRDHGAEVFPVFHSRGSVRFFFASQVYRWFDGIAIMETDKDYAGKDAKALKIHGPFSTASSPCGEPVKAPARPPWGNSGR